MANEKSGKQANEELKEYQRARKRILKTGDSAKSVISAIQNNTVPPPTTFTKKSMSEVVQSAAKLNIDLTKSLVPQQDSNVQTSQLECNFEAMNQRQMAIGQNLQQIAWAIFQDEGWRDNFLKFMDPKTLMQMIDMGIKIERQSMQGILVTKSQKESQDEQDGQLDLTARAKKNPGLIDQIHDLIQDDDEDDDE